MKYTMTNPCDQCPFLNKMRRGFSLSRLKAFASNEFPCHQTATLIEDEDGGSGYQANNNSAHCAGALIFNGKRGYTHQMMRICEWIGIYDASKLNMKALVR